MLLVKPSSKIFDLVKKTPTPITRTKKTSLSLEFSVKFFEWLKIHFESNKLRLSILNFSGKSFSYKTKKTQRC